MSTAPKPQPVSADPVFQDAFPAENQRRSGRRVHRQARVTRGPTKGFPGNSEEARSQNSCVATESPSAVFGDGDKKKGWERPLCA
jgi:hypothetical protein